MIMKKGLLPVVLAGTLLAVGGITATVAESVHTYREETALVQPVAVLKQGARGDEVKEVQRRLKEWGYYSGAVDGVYGAGTVAAVKAFQKKNGLTADGVCGLKTFEDRKSVV